MLEIALFTIGIAAIALFLQERFSVPLPVTIIVGIIELQVFGTAMGHPPMRISETDFDQLTYLALPILICSDALALRWDEIRRNAISLIYVAGIMIGLSVGLGILLNRFILPDYALAAPAMAALMCMVLATDPVTVSSVFGRFKLPHNLKVIAEGESLFNDASALIVFSIALTYMGMGGEHAVEEPFLYSFQMVSGALLIGFVIGWSGLQVLRFVHDAMTETMVVLAMALGSFSLAEHFHSSGILAVIVAILFANSVITKRLKGFEQQMPEESIRLGGTIGALLVSFEDMIKDAQDYKVLRANVQFAAIIAATILFISMANLVDVRLLMKYWKEIASVFIGTTVIRMAMLGLFARLSRWTDKVVTIPLHWWKILAAAGVKGAFSILMLHMIPDEFPLIELFEAVVVGNILLSTFLYPMALVLIIRVHKKRFAAEYEADHLAYEE
jgi:CPA1 family monovalent cation:H+ antiporter